MVEPDENLFVRNLAVSRFDTTQTILYGATQNAGVQSLIVQNDITSVQSKRGTSPNVHLLINNYPNPFNGSTSIQYRLPQEEEVKLEIFNMVGQSIYTIIDEKQHAGEHTKTIHLEKLPSGLYFYKITAGNFQQTKKMLLIK